MTSLPLSSLRVTIETLPPFGVNFTALPIRFDRTCSSLPESASDVAMLSLQPEVDANPRPFLLALEIPEREGGSPRARPPSRASAPTVPLTDMGEVEQLGD